MMTRYKNTNSRTACGQLPLFPAPYPGESFYSILCRYHVRSGNVNDWHTVRQLFGYNTSLMSTLLSPYHMENVKNWIPASAGITVENMLFQNTAFPLYSITSWVYSINCIRAIVIEGSTKGRLPCQVQTKLIHSSRHLRYCPECAKAQKQLYGESYWQVLPQLEGAEYCPIHKTRIKNSAVSLHDIRHHFFPASEALCNTPENSSDEQTAWKKLFDSEQDLFIRVSSGIAWLLHNGEKHEGDQTLAKMYSKVLENKENVNYFSTINLRKIKKLTRNYVCGDMLYRYLTASCNCNSFCGSEELYLYSLSTYAHVMLMVLLSGSPEAFYSTTYL